MKPHSTVLDLEYANRRKTRRSHRYRLWRRTQEVEKAIEKWSTTCPEAILDIGTADGRMIKTLSEKWSQTRFFGCEYSPALARMAREHNPQAQIVRGDAQSLPFASHGFDILVATAVLEHLHDPDAAMQEFKRVLRPGGIIVITAPDPFWEHLATRLGHLDDDQHASVLSMAEISARLTRSGLVVLETKKFMLSPIGFPCEERLEKTLCRLGCGFLLANQLIVARA